MRLLAAVLTALIGGWLLILTRGTFLALQGAHPDWYPVPSHPVARMAIYLTVAIGLQFLSAWILMSASAERGAAYRLSYIARVALGLCGCVVAVAAILFVSLLFCSDC